MAPGAQVVAVEVMRDETWERLQVAAGEELADRAAELGATLSEALQDEADARGQGQIVVARAAAYAGESEPIATISLRASASADAEPLEDGGYDGTQQGQVAQLQQHVQALIRLSVEERMATQRAVRQTLEMQGQVIERLLVRQERETERADVLREALAETAPEWLEVAKLALPALAPVLKRIGDGAKLKSRQKPPKDPPSTPEGSD